MRVAHLSDIHLGYRAYNRVTSQGLNVREADVFNAFRRSLDGIAELQPDLIIITGDLFHVVRPSNLCIDWTFREFLRLRTKTKAPIVVLGGNHDSPRSIDTGCILELLLHVPGTIVIHREYQGVEIPELGATVFCLCHTAIPMLSNLKLEPNSKSKYNILGIHGTFEGVAGRFYDCGPPITRSQIMDADWNYIALGHYHLYEKLADNAYYSGSLEYTSSNIWQETEKPKGFIEFDLDSRELVQFHQTATREVIDLRPIPAGGLTAAEINQHHDLRQRNQGIRASGVWASDR